MENIENLTRLEAAVEKLLNTVSEMKQEKLAFKARLASKEQEIETLGRELQAFQGERSKIENKVNGLLNAIEKWENLNGSAESSGADEAATVEKTLF
ncbi:MAG: cell division protein ZapB [Desulfobulbaceae bacterium]|nr:cell division protein ZapB [Desulfobulbaceae bacterium]